MMQSSLEDLITRLEDSRPRTRSDAAAELVDRCRVDEDTRGRFGMRFLTLLNDESPAVRGQAVVGSVLCDEELAHVDRVVRLLDDPSPGVRLQVVHALGPLGMTELLDSFASRIEDEDPVVRLATASVLATSGDIRGLPVLVEALEKRNTREEALHALRHIVAKADGRGMEAGARKILGSLFSSRFEKVAAAGLLAAMGFEEGRAFLLERIQKKGIDRPVAVELAGELHLREAEPFLAAFIATRSEPLRGTALRALASLGSSLALEACSQALWNEEEDADVRCDAAEGLLLLGGSGAEAALSRTVAEAGDKRVVKVAEACLALFGKPASEIRLYLPLSGEEVF